MKYRNEGQAFYAQNERTGEWFVCAVFASTVMAELAVRCMNNGDQDRQFRDAAADWQRTFDELHALIRTEYPDFDERVSLSPPPPRLLEVSG